MSVRSTICGVVLAGGRARRMAPDSPHGTDKALVPLAGEPMLSHVVRRVAPQVSRLIINANGAPERFSAFGLPVVPDSVDDRGPLAGLMAAMDWAGTNAPSCTAVLSVSTDTPFLPADLAAMLHAGAREGPAIAMSAGRLHPVVGLWPLSLRDDLQRTLDSGRLSVEKFAQDIQAIAVPFTLRTIGPVTLDPFFNANTPGELADAEAIAALVKNADA